MFLSDRIFPGNHNQEATPVPIPNTEVKLLSADGTAQGAEWESRSLPGFFLFGRMNVLFVIDDWELLSSQDPFPL